MERNKGGKVTVKQEQKFLKELAKFGTIKWGKDRLKDNGNRDMTCFLITENQSIYSGYGATKGEALQSLLNHINGKTEKGLDL